MTRVSGVIVLLFAAFVVNAQGPSADWRTLKTPHFRVHYPIEYEEWAQRAASRLESIRDAVTREVGYAPATVIDVLISNPVASPNGVAWPLLDTPRILLFTEPPGPDEQIGSYNNWIDQLTVHEVTHIIHMLRPSRNPLDRLVQRVVLPVGPITLAAPRWVLEGYATVIEGRLTGAGRPASTMRAAILRKWAATGRLPAYSELDSGARFLGLSMAYLMGSAYLEWLEQRGGPESLRRVWTRMTARQKRSFEQSFIGVFGDTPERLYGQFTAELTASAMAVNRAGQLREGELWQETSRDSGDPAVSPDGGQIAVVIRKQERPANLVVWQTGTPTDEETDFQKRLARILDRDPEDFAPIEGKPLPRKALYTLTLPDGGDIESPRWTADGRAIIYSHRQRDTDGDLRHDLFRWIPGAGRNERLTHRADVSDADPLPTGDAAIGVRTRNGFSQLVRVDLRNGAVAPLTEPSLDRVEAHPRVSRDGATLAYVSHRNGTWRLISRTLDTGVETEVASPTFSYAAPEWSRRRAEELFVVASAAGHAEIHRVRSASTVPVTRSSGVAMSPAPSPDGRLFFMALDPDGFNVRVIDGEGEAPAAPPFDPSRVPAVPPPPAQARAFAAQELSPARPYGIGRQELTALFALQAAPSQNAVEVGVRLGDVIGRLDTIAIAAVGQDEAQKGVAIASAWRGWPVHVSAHAFTAEDDRTSSDGVEVRGSWTRRSALTTLSVDGGGLAGDPMEIAFGHARLDARYVTSTWRGEGSLHAAAETGSTDHVRAVVWGALRRGSLRVGVRLQHDGITDGSGVIEVGGIASSLLPRSAYSLRILDPALPVGTLRTDRYDGVRIETSVPSLPFTAFYQRHVTRTDDLSLAGIEITMRQAPLPVLRLPAFDLTAGVARILDAPLENRTKWWFGLRWIP
jgi:hypothetical protein